MWVKAKILQVIFYTYHLLYCLFSSILICFIICCYFSIDRFPQENKDTFSGITQAATEAINKSKEIRGNLSEQTNAYSKEFGKKIDEMEKKVDETKEAVEKSSILEKSKEALRVSKETLEKSEKLAKEAAEKVG